MTVVDQREPRVSRIPRPSRLLSFLPQTAFAIDMAMMVLAVSVAVVGRERWDIFPDATSVRDQLGSAWLLIVVGWLVLIAWTGGYARSVFDAGTDEYRRVLRASALMAGTVGIASYLGNLQLSRGFFFLTFVLGAPALVLGRMGLRHVVHGARRLGTLHHTVLLVGSSVSVDDVAVVLRRDSRLGYRVVGALTPTCDPAETPDGVPVLGHSDDVVAMVRRLGVDIVFFTAGAVERGSQMRQIAWELEHDQVQVVVAPSVSEVSGERVRVRPVGGLPLIHLDPPRTLDAARWGKRLFDILGSAALLVSFSMVMGLIALRVKLDDGGPVLFRQTRVGRDGLEFACLKFRTMVVDAEERLAQLHSEAGYETGLFKMKEDPRVTDPGRWIRRFSLDELPQLVNVFRGEMSLVGPRPPLPLEVSQYDEQTARRLRVRPGMTGLWQVSGRSDLSWDEAIRLDLFYVDNWSLIQDLSILVKTLGAVLRSHGAY